MKTYRIDRESYRAWRAQCPKELLSETTQIQKWLGATPAIAPAESIPPVPQAASPATPESIPPVQSLPGKRRDDALTPAIRAAIAALNPAGGLPQPKALFDYLRHFDKTGVIVESSNDLLTWYTAEESKKKTANIANLRQRLDRWKG